MGDAVPAICKSVDVCLDGLSNLKGDLHRATLVPHVPQSGPTILFGSRRNCLKHLAKAEVWPGMPRAETGLEMRPAVLIRFMALSLAVAGSSPALALMPNQATCECYVQLRTGYADQRIFQYKWQVAAEEDRLEHGMVFLLPTPFEAYPSLEYCEAVKDSACRSKCLLAMRESVETSEMVYTLRLESNPLDFLKARYGAQCMVGEGVPRRILYHEITEESFGSDFLHRQITPEVVVPDALAPKLYPLPPGYITVNDMMDFIGGSLLVAAGTYGVGTAFDWAWGVLSLLQKYEMVAATVSVTGTVVLIPWNEAVTATARQPDIICRRIGHSQIAVKAVCDDTSVRQSWILKKNSKNEITVDRE